MSHSTPPFKVGKPVVPLILPLLIYKRESNTIKQTKQKEIWRVKEVGLLISYRGTPLIRSPLGRENAVITTGWSD